MHKNKTNHVNDLFQTPQELVDHLPGIAAWKDKDSKYIAANKLAAKLAGFNSINDLIGIDDYHLKERISECAEIFIAQDQKAINTKRNISILGIHLYLDQTVRTLHTEKKPVFDSQGKIMGTFFYSTIINDAFLIEIGKQLIRVDSRYKECTCQASYLIEAGYNKDFSQKENEILFFLARGKTSSDIAKILCRSKRTIETHIENIKFKLKCKKKSDLIEKAIELGYLGILPKHLIKKNLSFILKEC